MNKKIIQVTKTSLPPIEGYIEQLKEIWESAWISNMGPKHNELQTKLKEYLHVPHLSLFSNGHMALELLIQAMGLTGEIITTPFTFASTTHAIVRNGCVPVFCDIKKEDYTIDAGKIENLITPRTSAILPVHVYGNICDVEKIEQIAQKYHLKVLYDAAHTFGEEYRGKGIGSYGDAAMFSFHATKVFHTIEGGAIAYKEEWIGRKLYQLKNFGIKDAETVDGIGANAKMNEFQAIMGLCNLKYIDAEIEKRRSIADRYFRNLNGVKGIVLNRVREEVKSNYAYFPVLFDPELFGHNRDDVYERLKKQNIYARKYFYPLTNEYDCYRGRFDSEKTPVAREVSHQILTLPLFADLKFEDVDRICSIILEGR